MQPQRRTEPRKHLDASLAPLERALMSVAQELMNQSAGASQDGVAPATPVIGAHLARTLRDVAEELHYW